MRKIYKTIFYLILLVTIPFFVFVLIYTRVYTTTDAYLSVKEFSGTDRVFIDNSYIGNSPLIQKVIPSGMHIVKIIKISKSNYYVFNENLLFTKNTGLFINLTLGPSEEYTFYSITSLEKDAYNDTGLFLITIPQNGSITIHGNQSVAQEKFVPFSVGSYDIIFQNKGYSSYTEPIEIVNGYILNFILHPFKIPI